MVHFCAFSTAKGTTMKTIIVPVIDWSRVEKMDVGYVQRWLGEVLDATGSWSATVRWFLERSDPYPMRRAWRSYFLAVGVTYRSEIESIAAEFALERSVGHLPGLRPEAARSAAPA